MTIPIDPISARIEAAAISLSSNPQIWITIAQWVYQKVTAPKPLEDTAGDPRYQDRRHYTELCRLRKFVSKAQEATPIEWELDEKGCPKYKTNFYENALNIKARVEGLSTSDYPQKAMVLGMLTQISHLFKELHERWNWYKPWTGQGWKVIREDGPEVMFFSDLAVWLSVDLPRYDVKNPNTANFVENWIKYAKAVQSNVLIYRDVSPKHYDPKYCLANLIDRLERLHGNICKASRAATFNDHIRTIELAYLDMIRHTFNFLFLLLYRVHQNDFLVSQFLTAHNPTLGIATDEKMSTLVSYLMGQWIIATLQKTGISENDYVPTPTIDIRTISQHLVTDFEAITQSKIQQTGLMKFAWQNREKALNYLQDTVEIHRLLLKHCYVFDTILLSAKVHSGLGHAWLYGEDTGKEMVAKLIAVIDHASQELSQHIKVFWNKFYHQDYQIFATTKGKDDKSNTYQRLTRANECVEHITSSQNTIKETTKRIAEGVNDPENSLAAIRRKVLELGRKLDDYIALSHVEVKPLVNLDEPFKPTSSQNAIHQVLGDGNCFFYAVSNEMRRQNIEVVQHRRLRENGVAYLKEHPQILIDHPPENETPEVYLERMKKNKTWVEGPLIDAVALICDVRLIIYDVRQNPNGTFQFHTLKPINEQGARGTICLILKEGHYDALELHDEAELSAVIVRTYLFENTSVLASQSSWVKVVESYLTKTIIHLEKGPLGLVDTAIKLLNGTSLTDYSAHLALDLVLMTKPEKFHSNLQEEIYDEFLCSYFHAVDIMWPFSFFRNIDPQKQPALRILYAKINAVMKLLYWVKVKNAAGEDVPIQLSPVEIDLFDFLLYYALMEEFQEHNFHYFSLKNRPKKLQFSGNEQEIVLEFDALQINHGEFFQRLKETMVHVDEKDAQIKKLSDECEEYKQALKEKEDIIRTRDATNMELRQENANLSQENANLSQENANLSQENANLSQENANLSQENVKFRQENAKFRQENIDEKRKYEEKYTTLNEELRERNQTIAALQRQFQELQARLSSGRKHFQFFPSSTGTQHAKNDEENTFAYS